MLLVKELQELLAAYRMKWKVHFLENIDSTNAEAARLAEAGAEEGLLVIADSQESGRGRRGRSWESQAGNNIFMTLLLKPDFSPEKASMITLVAALAVAEAIRSLTGQDAKIKWPNDIVINGKKVVGILTELSLSGMKIAHIVCGIGINVNQEVFGKEIADTATSLYLQSGEKVDRTRLIAEVMKRFEELYAIFGMTGSLEALQETYNSLLVNKDAMVRVLDPKESFEGIALGINEKGELNVQKEDGTIEAVYAGEVSIRGIYGYV